MSPPGRTLSGPANRWSSFHIATTCTGSRRRRSASSCPARIRASTFLVLPLKMGTSLNWTPDRNMPEDSRYVLRVYELEGPLRRNPCEVVAHPRSHDRPRLRQDDRPARRIRRKQPPRPEHPHQRGSVTVSGKNMAEGERVIALGAEVPSRRARSLRYAPALPSGTHTVEVMTTPIFGEQTTYTRNPRSTATRGSTLRSVS